MKNIDEMKNWDILTYLRLKREWMVQSHYTREDISRNFDKDFSDEEWEAFCEIACDSFDNVKVEIMTAIIELWDEIRPT